jgi:hypothetical protein
MAWHPDMTRIIEAVQSAPSVFSRRLWDVRLADEGQDRVDLYADPSAAAGAAMPREVAISCGAALYNLRLAIQVAGHTPSVWLLPGMDGESVLLDQLGAGRILVASVEIMPDRTAPPTAGVQEMYEAMWLRHAPAGPDPVLPIPLPLLVEMENAAAEEHGWLRVLHPREQRLMLREAASAGADTASLGRRVQLMSLSTDDDRPLDWLRAGQALQHALLTGTRYSMSGPSGRSERYRVSLKYGWSDWHPLRPPRRVPGDYGITASFLPQPLELDDRRRRTRRWPWRSYYNEVPQMVLRVAFAPVERVSAPPLYQSPPERLA